MWSLGIVFALVIAGFLRTIQVQVARTIDLKLRVLQHHLIVTFPGLAAAGIVYALTMRDAVRDAKRLPGESGGAELVAAVGELHMHTTVMVTGLLMVLALTAIQVFMVVTELRQFIRDQEVDLTVRDQVALRVADAALAERKVPTS